MAAQRGETNGEVETEEEDVFAKAPAKKPAKQKVSKTVAATREEAIAIGARMGQLEQERIGVDDKGVRARRAAAYAAWRFDLEHGIDLPWDDYCKEFEITKAKLTGVADRPAPK